MTIVTTFAVTIIVTITITSTIIIFIIVMVIVSVIIEAPMLQLPCLPWLSYPYHPYAPHHHLRRCRDLFCPDTHTWNVLESTASTVAFTVETIFDIGFCLDLSLFNPFLFLNLSCFILRLVASWTRPQGDDRGEVGQRTLFVAHVGHRLWRSRQGSTTYWCHYLKLQCTSVAQTYLVFVQNPRHGAAMQHKDGLTPGGFQCYQGKKPHADYIEANKICILLTGYGNYVLCLRGWRSIAEALSGPSCQSARSRRSPSWRPELDGANSHGLFAMNSFSYLYSSSYC